MNTGQFILWELFCTAYVLLLARQLRAFRRLREVHAYRMLMIDFWAIEITGDHNESMRRLAWATFQPRHDEMCASSRDLDDLVHGEFKSEWIAFKEINREALRRYTV